MEDPAPYSTARQKHRKVEVLIGDYGNDTIRARDGKKDIVRGGPGYDKAYVDGVDKVTGVEVERCGGGGCTKPPGSGVTTPPGDKPPEAVYDNPTVEERNCASDPPRPLDVVNNDTDDDGGPMTIQSVTQPDNGEVTITNNGNDLTYKPVVGYYNDDTDGTVDPPDDFTYTLNGGSTAQVDVIVELAGGCASLRPPRCWIITAVSNSGPVNEGYPATIRVTATALDNSAANLHATDTVRKHLRRGFARLLCLIAGCTYDTNRQASDKQPQPLHC